MPMSPADSSARFDLVTLGGLRITAGAAARDGDGLQADALNARKRVLAVLTVLALSERPLSRDTLADFLWSDRDPVRARHSLAEALSYLRSILGRDAIASRAQELSLSPGAPVRVDAAVFSAAVDGGAWQTAIAYYGGPFLDGVYVERAPRFDDWAMRERERLRERIAFACASECAQQTAQGRSGDVAAIARRWLDECPLDTNAAVHWFTALAAPGTRDAHRLTLEQFTAYRDHLDREYEFAPEPEIVAVITRIREAVERDKPSPSNRMPPADEAMTDRLIVDVAEPTVVAVEPTAVAAEPTASTTATPRRAAPRRRLAIAASILLVAAAANARFVGRWFGASFGASADVLPTPTLVVVTDAENSTGDAGLGAAVSVAVSTALGDARTVRVLSADRVRSLRAMSSPLGDSTRTDGAPFTEMRARDVAQRSGAAAVVVPIVVALGPRFRVATRIVNPVDGQAVATFQTEPVDSTQLLRAIDDVVRQARHQFGETAKQGRTNPPLPDATTTSLAALRYYATGLDAFNRSDYGAARAALEKAVLADSSFALAWAQLGAVHAWTNDPLGSERAFLMAERFLSRLTPREQMIASASIARWRAQPEQAASIRARWLAAHPEDVGTMSAHAYDLFRARKYAQAIAQYESLLRRDSTDDNAWFNLGASYRVIGSPGSYDRSLRAYAAGFRLVPRALDEAGMLQAYGSLLVESGRADSAARIFTRALAGEPGVAARGNRSLGMLAIWRGQPRDAIAPLQRAIDATVRLKQPLSELRGRLLLVQAWRMLGASAEATRERARVLAVSRAVTEPTALYWAGQLLARSGNISGASELLDTLRARSIAANPTHRAARQLLESELAVARGKPAEGVRLATAGASGDSTVISYESIAYAVERSGNRAQARQRYEAIAQTRFSFGWEGTLVQLVAPQIAAQLARADGDTAAATRWDVYARERAFSRK
ncbi:BTAD domain-containing putative transcriptional regulator [Gemmatimonas sp.]|uniref:BTAD domain-containing putative transcriptional regulator n=1 Tax=Gemmatimonas sp. TaxID=1962908 RepID=UPI00286D8E92|nr:BTAD domain-containing putative transcriptional regulator [Gemmatimonas sp.]